MEFMKGNQGRWQTLQLLKVSNQEDLTQTNAVKHAYNPEGWNCLETLGRPLLVLCPTCASPGPFAPRSFPAFPCSTLMWGTRPCSLFPMLPHQLASNWIYPTGTLIKDWKAGGREKPQYLSHSLSVLGRISSRGMLPHWLQLMKDRQLWMTLIMGSNHTFSLCPYREG